MVQKTVKSTIKTQGFIDIVQRLNLANRLPSENSYSHEDVILHPEKFVNYGFSIYPSQGELIYLLCRAIGAKRVIDFATSLGMSALYFAAAMKDNGGGQVSGSELVPEKAKIAMTNLEGAGLRQYVDIKVGDARRTLRTVDGPIDFALIDGWPGNEGVSLAREVMEIITPKLRVGALIMNDNGEPDFMEYIHNPRNGFISISLPIKTTTELAMKLF